jgi:hypothetical protein
MVDNFYRRDERFSPAITGHEKIFLPIAVLKPFGLPGVRFDTEEFFRKKRNIFDRAPPVGP